MPCSCSTSSGAVAAAVVLDQQQKRRPGASQERSRGGIGSVAASGNATGALQEQDRERCRIVDVTGTLRGHVWLR